MWMGDPVSYFTQTSEFFEVPGVRETGCDGPEEAVKEGERVKFKPKKNV